MDFPTNRAYRFNVYGPIRPKTGPKSSIPGNLFADAGQQGGLHILRTISVSFCGFAGGLLDLFPVSSAVVP